jgi:sulfide:quinone oxidoreductase
VLIAGAGVAGLEAMLALRDLAGERVVIDVLAPDPAFFYWPLLLAEPFGGAPTESIDLGPLFERHGIRFHPGMLRSIDAAARTIETTERERMGYDALIIASGARHVEGVAGALTFPGLHEVEAMRALLDELAAGRVRRVAFALPAGSGWPFPIYELALMTASELEKRGASRAELVLVTPESDPLGLFGAKASDAVRKLLENRGIELVPRTYPVAVDRRGLRVHPGELLAAERVVALSRLEGAGIDGVPQDASGFIPVDRHGRVVGLEAVYAAGDAIAFPVKQGGIAAQQAVAAAEMIAASAGAALTPQPFRPVLRGLFLGDAAPRYLRSELTGGFGESSLVSLEPLWWPPAKIAGRYLGPALAELTGEPVPQAPAAGPDAVEVERELPEDVEASPGTIP